MNAAMHMENQTNEHHGTVSETIRALEREGYSVDFNLTPFAADGFPYDNILSPLDYQIDKVYRFEGATNPDDQSILYAISSVRLQIKGILLNGYGMYADLAANAVLSRLTTRTSY